MMMAFFLFGGLLLAWAFGRNNFSNVFGSAVGTGILSFRLAAFLTGTFLLIGALLNGSGTSNTLSSLVHFMTLSEVFFFSLIVAVMMLVLTYRGIPASVAQISIGTLVGWNLALNIPIMWDKITSIILGWIYSPLIAFTISFIIFKMARFYLKYVPVPILYRDMRVRLLWIIVGSFTAYSLGANNMPLLTISYSEVVPEISKTITILFSIVAGVGCLFASQKVIQMISSKLFPLSSLESLIVSFSSALTLLLFSFQNGFLPALPISISAAMIGAIVGVSLAKGGYGLRIGSLLVIVFSWIWAPLFSGMLSYMFILLMSFWGI